jgi:uncharacterized protein (DUF1697 family)
MNKRIALLRGINVGGKRKILMSDLKLLFENLGFTSVVTYIQSGNVIFNSELGLSNNDICEIIKNEISDKFGFEVPVIVRTTKEISQTIKKNPYCKNNNIDIKRLCLTFLEDKPELDNRKNTEDYNFEPDKFLIDGKDVFIYCAGQYHKSKLTNNFFESKLKVSATTRNWKTVLKLLELSKL